MRTPPAIPTRAPATALVTLNQESALPAMSRVKAKADRQWPETFQVALPAKRPAVVVSARAVLACRGTGSARIQVTGLELARARAAVREADPFPELRFRVEKTRPRTII